MRTELEMALAEAVKKKWGDVSVEYLVGALSSITTEDQLKSLIKGVTNENSN